MVSELCASDGVKHDDGKVALQGTPDTVLPINLDFDSHRLVGNSVTYLLFD